MNEHSPQFERFKRLYLEGRMTEKGLQNAVKRGLITQAEYLEIIGDQDNLQQYANKVKSGEMLLDAVPSEYRDDVFLLLQQMN